MRPVEVVYLYRSDTLALVRELLRTATPGAQVWLVSPWRARVTASLVNLKQLQRAAESTGIDLRLVSPHFQTRVLAREAGIPVYFFVPWRLRRYRRARDSARVAAKRVVSVQGQLGRRYARRPRFVGLGTAFASLLVIVLLLAAIAGVGAAFVPSATISLDPVAKTVSASLSVTADPTYREVDLERIIIPARVIQLILEGRGETPAMGRFDVPDGRAVGEVVLVNKTSGSLKVPKGTIVRTSSGLSVRFYTVADVDLPAVMLGQARVGIIAVDAGPAGNVKPVTINVVEGPVGHSVDVLNDSPTLGGSNKQVATVAPKEFDQLRTDLVKRLQQEAYTQLGAGLGPGEFIPSASLEAQVMSEQFDQVIGQQNDVLSGSMKVVVRGIAVDGQSLETLAFQVLGAQAGEGMSLIEDSVTVQRDEQVHVERNTVRLETSVRGVAASSIDVGYVRTSLRGKETAQAGAWLSHNLKLQREPRIDMFPAWWQWMPLMPARMHIIISSGQG